MTDESARPARSGTKDAVLVRAEGPARETTPGTFLRRFSGLPRGYWEREGRWSAWAGAAARLEVARGREAAFAEIRDRSRTLFARLEEAAPDPRAGSPPRLYGGFAFDPARAPGDGGGAYGTAFPAGLPGALFVFPAVELRAGDGPARVAVTVSVPAGTGPAEARAAVRRALGRIRATVGEPAPAEEPGPVAGPSRPAGGGPGPGVRRVRRTPELGGWRGMVEDALEAVAAGRLEKVVPARCLELELERPAGAVEVLEALRGGGAGTFPYLLEPAGGTFLAGAAPEIAAAREGGRFHATAVAGTVREGADPAESERLARRLLSSEKDRREHAIGVRDMREALRDVAGVPEVDQAPRVLRLQGMQHLLTNLSAPVPDDLHVLDLLATLHPAAAVNGRPRGAALGFLRSREPFDRGWFGGPVGWFDAAGDGVFVPALRSVLAGGRRARICAGAGVVEGSRPAPEWDETGVKLRPALRALGLEGAAAARAAGCGDGSAAGTPEAEVAPASESGA